MAREQKILQPEWKLNQDRSFLEKFLQTFVPKLPLRYLKAKLPSLMSLQVQTIHHHKSKTFRNWIAATKWIVRSWNGYSPDKKCIKQPDWNWMKNQLNDAHY